MVAASLPRWALFVNSRLFHLSRRLPSVLTSARKMNSACEAPRKNPLVAVCQMTSTARKDENLRVSEQLIEKAASKGAQMIFLPEGFDYIANNKEESVAMSEPLDGPIMQHFKNLAKKLNVWLSLGGFHQKSEDDHKLRNSHVIIDGVGSIVAVYDKTHLFDIDINQPDRKVRMKESDFTIKGSTLCPPVQTPVGKVGLSIECYDLRFPELSLVLASQGAEILTYPSAFMVSTGRAHWEVQLRNKAIENQCYVIAAAQTGDHNEKRASYGHSMIIDPWGRIIGSCGEEVRVSVAEIDLDYLKKVREEMPLSNHRRDDLYGRLGSKPHSLESAIQIAISQLVSEIQYTGSNGHFKFGSVMVKDSQLFYRTTSSVAFVNNMPVLPGHVLVAPVAIKKRLRDLTASEVADLFLCVQKVQKAVELEYEAPSSTIAIQDGPEAGQTIEHVHVHVLPRKGGEFSRNDDIYEKLENHDKTADKPRRSEADMESEAERLKSRMVQL